jgi:hypothetical protein
MLLRGAEVLFLTPDPISRYFAYKSDLAATAHSLHLVKALKYRMWEGTSQQCR